jgi:hypothetical protein
MRFAAETISPLTASWITEPAAAGEQLKRSAARPWTSGPTSEKVSTNITMVCTRSVVSATLESPRRRLQSPSTNKDKNFHYPDSPSLVCFPVDEEEVPENEDIQIDDTNLTHQRID